MLNNSWGFKMLWADTQLYSAHMLVIKDGERTSYVYYKKRDFTIFVLHGPVMLVEEGKNRTIDEGQSYRILPGIMHRLVAIKGAATVLEVGTKLEEDDEILVEE